MFNCWRGRCMPVSDDVTFRKPSLSSSLGTYLLLLLCQRRLESEGRPPTLLITVILFRRSVSQYHLLLLVTGARSLSGGVSPKGHVWDKNSRERGMVASSLPATNMTFSRMVRLLQISALKIGDYLDDGGTSSCSPFLETYSRSPSLPPELY